MERSQVAFPKHEFPEMLIGPAIAAHQDAKYFFSFIKIATRNKFYAGTFPTRHSASSFLWENAVPNMKHVRIELAPTGYFNKRRIFICISVQDIPVAGAMVQWDVIVECEDGMAHEIFDISRKASIESLLLQGSCSDNV